MPILHADLAVEIEAEIVKATAIDRPEVGVGLACEYLRDRSGVMIAYRVTLTTDNGLTKTFPDVAATSPPDIEALVKEYQDETLAEIHKRREARIDSAVKSG